MARWRDPTASTPRSSTASSKAKSSTTPTSSPRSCKSGRTTTTTTALTAHWPAKHRTNDYDRKPKTHCHRPPSVAHCQCEPRPPRALLGLGEVRSAHNRQGWSQASPGSRSEACAFPSVNYAAIVPRAESPILLSRLFGQPDMRPLTALRSSLRSWLSARDRNVSSNLPWGPLPRHQHGISTVILATAAVYPRVGGFPHRVSCRLSGFQDLFERVEVGCHRCLDPGGGEGSQQSQYT